MAVSADPGPRPALQRRHAVLAGAIAAGVLVVGGLTFALRPTSSDPGAAGDPTTTSTPARRPPATTASVTPQASEPLVGPPEGGTLPPPRPPAVLSPPPGVTVPAVPSGLYVSRRAGTHDYHFEWVDNSDNEGGFTVYFSDGHRADVVDHRYWYERANLAPDMQICFTVDAYNAAGHSAAPPWMCVTTPPPPPTTAPAAPSGLTVAVNPVNATVDLRWTDNSGNEEFFYYRSTRDGVSQGDRQVPANATTARMNVDRGVTYCFAVRAYNIVGSSAWSNESCVWVEPSPAGPTGLTATVDGTTVHLVWTDNATNEDGFKVNLVALGTIATRTLPPDTTTYDWTGVPLGTRVCFSVRAFNEVGTSNPTSAPCVTLPAGEPTPTG